MYPLHTVAKFKRTNPLVWDDVRQTFKPKRGRPCKVTYTSTKEIVKDWNDGVKVKTIRVRANLPSNQAVYQRVYHARKRGMDVALRNIRKSHIDIPKLYKAKVRKDYTPYLILAGLAVLFIFAVFQGWLSGEQFVR